MFFPNLVRISDVKGRFLCDRVQLLRDIVKACALNLPFQNVTSFGVPNPGPKPIPSFKALLDTVHKQHGGMCAHNNYTLKLILDSVGFKTFNAAAKFRRTLTEASHLVSIVRIPPPHSQDGETEDLYLVDAGCGVPLFEPIRLKDLPYKGRAGGFDFSYELNPEGTAINRIHRGGDPFVGKKPDDYLCPQDYTVQLEPRDTSWWYPRWGQVYGLPKTSGLHNTFYLFRYLHISEDNSDFKIVCIRGKELLFITRETRTMERFPTYQDLEPLIYEYFPMLLPHEVKTSITNFSRIESGDVKVD